jgi:pimeloyl-[acyl-carrier protein] synthase
MTVRSPVLFSAEFFADPFAYYGRLRETQPVAWDAQYEMWLVTSYRDVSAIIRQPGVFSSVLGRDSRSASPPVRDEDTALLAEVNAYRVLEFIQMDPPEHTARRKLLSPRFLPRRMEELRPLVRGIVNELLDAVVDDGQMDVLTAVGRPLPMRIISELMGFDSDQRPDIADQASRRMASVLSLDADRMDRAAGGFAETAALVSRAVDERLEPGCPVREDVLGDIAAAERAGAFKRPESQANAMLLIDAGHETTVQLICNGTLSLLRHPDQWARLTSDPDRYVESATEECLRFDPPLHAFRRVVARDTELGGQVLRAGDRVHAVIASANRDPECFQDPDRFDIGRRPNAHVAFGAGAHYCLGQYLARMEGQEYLRALATRLPCLRLEATEVSYFQTPRVRSITALPVSWR